MKNHPQPLDNNLPDLKNMLFWPPAERIIGFRNEYRTYPGDRVKCGLAYSLPLALQSLESIRYTLNNHSYSLKEYLTRQNATGFLVMQQGKIIYHYYGAGNTPTTLWSSYSVAKSIVSILVGIALKAGAIRSLSDPITHYVPEMQDTAWEGVNLQHLLQHTSGIDWHEHYSPHSYFAQLKQFEAANHNTYQQVFNLVSSLKRQKGVKPGERWCYTSAGSWLLGLVLERATNSTLANYMQQQIWQSFGMEQDAVWQAYLPGKSDMGGYGFNAALHDWARFGQFILNQDRLPAAQKKLPTDWLDASSHWCQAKECVTPQFPDGEYGYQWWNNSVPANLRYCSPMGSPDSIKTLWAIGIFGQIIAINRTTEIIMVQWSTWKEADPTDHTYPEVALLFNAISNHLIQ